MNPGYEDNAHRLYAWSRADLEMIKIHNVVDGLDHAVAQNRCKRDFMSEKKYFLLEGAISHIV